MFDTEEEIQVTIPTGIPVVPSMRPVRPSEIASVMTENFDRMQFARLISRIEYELCAAFRRR